MRSAHSSSEALLSVYGSKRMRLISPILVCTALAVSLGGCGEDDRASSRWLAAEPIRGGNMVRVVVAGSVSTAIIGADVRSDGDEIGIAVKVEGDPSQDQIELLEFACADVELPSAVDGRAIVDDGEGEANPFGASANAAMDYANAPGTECAQIVR